MKKPSRKFNLFAAAGISQFFTLTLGMVILAGMVFAQNTWAGDKIGNGAGLWACKNGNDKIIQLLFIDIFEARVEHKLTVPELSGPYLDEVQKQKNWIAIYLPLQAMRLITEIDYVQENNITWLEDASLNTIPDSLDRVRPGASLCNGKEWTAIQLVNFTNKKNILIVKELFDSPLITEVQRAAVFLHEGIYSYLRTEFGDTDSVRTREIVGILLSDKSDQVKVEKIQSILAQAVKPPPPPPPPPAAGWACGIRLSPSQPLYFFEAQIKEEAIAGVINVCKKGEDPFGGMFGGGFTIPFPGGSGGEGGPGMPPGFSVPGPGMDCRENKVTCEKFTSLELVKTCEMVSFFGDKTFTGHGKLFWKRKKK